MATDDKAATSIGQQNLNSQEKRAFDASLYQVADLINRINADRVPYTKLKIGGQ